MGANIENNIVVEETLRGIAQLVRPWICSLEVTSSSPTRPLKTYMVVNFRACGISRGACKLAQTPMLIKNIYIVVEDELVFDGDI